MMVIPLLSLALSSKSVPQADGVSAYIVSFNRPCTEGDGTGAQDPLMPNSSGATSTQAQAAYADAVSTSMVARSDQDQAQDVCSSYGATLDHIFPEADGFLARMTDAAAHPEAKIGDVNSWIKNSAQKRMQGDLKKSPNKFLYLAPGGY